MLRFAVLAVFVSVAVAQTKFCCAPDQWESYVGIVLGTVQGETAHLVNGSSRLSYDYTDSMTAVTAVITVDGKMQHVKIIRNYQKKMTYIIVDSVCTPVQLTGDMKKMCVPDNAVSTGKVYYGQSGSGLTADTYMFQDGPELTVYASVTTTNPCLPIGAVMFGASNQVGMVETYGFVNSTTGIKDPSVFTPPKSCGSVKAVRDVSILDDAVVNYMNMMMTSA